jgi:hypothetical protein
MKRLAQTLIVIVLAAASTACGMWRAQDRTRTTDTVADSRMSELRTSEPVVTKPQTESEATQSAAVRERIAQDRAIDARRLTVQSDGGTVYLNGSVGTAEQKARAEQRALEVAGVSAVVNQLRTRSGHEEMARTREASGGTCTLIVRNPAARTESGFIPVQLRVYDDITSPLYTGPRPSRYEERTGRVYDERTGEYYDARTGRLYEERTGRVPDERTARVEESRVAPGSSSAPALETPPASIGETSTGSTGGKTQETGSAQQGGTFEQSGRERLESGERFTAEERALSAEERARLRKERAHLTPEERARLTPEERARLYGEEARVSERHGELLWSGWARNGEKIDIASNGRAIRYEYRFQADDRFHDNQRAWCNDGRGIAVP